MRLKNFTLSQKNKLLGFWLFLSAEIVLFACLFGVYLALKGSFASYFRNLVDLKLIFLATILLLSSSFTIKIATSLMFNVDLKTKDYPLDKRVILCLVLTILLGLMFVFLEVYEFMHYVQKGFLFSKNAFASSFYTLIGTHCLHVLFGICWLCTLLIQFLKNYLSYEKVLFKIYICSLYWYFVDIVWIFIFTFGYLLGVVS